MKYSKELIEKAKTAKTAEELLAMAKAENIEMTAEEAAKYFAELHKTGELSDEELDNVAGGRLCSPGDPKWNIGDRVRYYYEYVSTIARVEVSVITDRRIAEDEVNWEYKLERGSWDGAEYIYEFRILSLA